MKATVLKFYDEQGNEIKNVSTEIVLNGETYVKKEVDKQPDYSHLVGMWVRCTYGGFNIRKNTWYYIESIKDGRLEIVYSDGSKQHAIGSYMRDHFDLTNPKSYNPDAVVGLKELPNDGKTYAKAKETFHMKSDNRVFLIEGLWYKNTGKDLYHTEIDENHSFDRIVLDFFSEIGCVENVKLAKQVWESCRETMWEYYSSLGIWTKDPDNDNQDESLTKLTKHLNALAYLSEVARRCNGDRVVDWGCARTTKFYVYRYNDGLRRDVTFRVYKEIAFLDREARDHSFEVDKHIWNDYYGLPNE